MKALHVALLALGAGGLLYWASSPAAGARAPSGATWPKGITTPDASRAVAYALAHETDAAKLHAFATLMEGFDVQAANALHARARELDAQALPQGSQLGVLSGGSTFTRGA